MKHLRIVRGGYFILIAFFIQKNYANAPLRIVGSSAVFPFAATVAEHFSYKTQEPVPIIEAIGTGAGVKLFCESVIGPDGAITSRPLTEGEIKKCKERGVTFEEFKIGQDGLVLIQNKEEPLFFLTLKLLNDALAEKLFLRKSCIKNPYKIWKDIQTDFPSYPIRVLGPTPTSGTYDVLIAKLEGPCGSLLRHDGAYIEAPANENLIIQKVMQSRYTLGIVTFGFYDQNSYRLHALPLNGVFPSFLSIQKGDYPLSRPLYLYLKTNNLTLHPARAAYACEFTSPLANGEEGYLNEKGLVPLSLEEQTLMHQRAKVLQEEGVK